MEDNVFQAFYWATSELYVTPFYNRRVFRLTSFRSEKKTSVGSNVNPFDLNRMLLAFLGAESLNTPILKDWTFTLIVEHFRQEKVLVISKQSMDALLRFLLQASVKASDLLLPLQEIVKQLLEADPSVPINHTLQVTEQCHKLAWLQGQVYYIELVRMQGRPREHPGHLPTTLPSPQKLRLFGGHFTLLRFWQRCLKTVPICSNLKCLAKWRDMGNHSHWSPIFDPVKFLGGFLEKPTTDIDSIPEHRCPILVHAQNNFNHLSSNMAEYFNEHRQTVS